MDSNVAAIARRTAASFGSDVAIALEQRMASGDDARQVRHFGVDPATAANLVGLIIGAAGLAWTIAQAILGAGGAPSADAVADRVIERLRREGLIPALPQATLDAVIQRAVAEALAQQRIAPNPEKPE